MYIKENMAVLSSLEEGESVRFVGTTYPTIRLEDDGYYLIGKNGNYFHKYRYSSVVRMSVTLFCNRLEKVL